MDAGKAMEHELGKEDWFKVIDQFALEYEGAKVTFTGGEPLSYPGIFDLLEHAWKRGLLIELFSNGTLINKKNMAMIKRFVSIVQFSLDGATAEVNDLIRGKNVFKRVLNAVDLLRDENILVRLSMTLMPQNAQDIKENIVSLMFSLGRHVELKLGLGIVEGRADTDVNFTNPLQGQEVIADILKVLYRKRLKAMRKIEPNLRTQNCGYGEVITVNSDGLIYPCALPKYNHGNIRKTDFKSVLRKFGQEKEASNVDKLDGCSKCDVRYFCFAGCRLNNITFNGDVTRVTCSPGRKKEVLRRLIQEHRFDPIKYWTSMAV